MPPPHSLDALGVSGGMEYLTTKAERSIAAAVTDARAHGFSWATIGTMLGTSGEAARQRYGAKQQA